VPFLNGEVSRAEVSISAGMKVFMEKLLLWKLSFIPVKNYGEEYVEKYVNRLDPYGGNTGRGCRWR
jgi:hypothetical protein